MKNVLEAISCLHQLPIASAQTLTLADISGEIALVECTPDRVEVTTSLSNTHSFVCDTNAFHLTKMMQYNSVGIDDWFAETRFQTMISAFQNTKKIDLVFVKKLLSGDYGFLCQYDRSTGKDTVWSVIYDLKQHKIYRSEGNPRRCNFKEDTRFCF